MEQFDLIQRAKAGDRMAFSEWMDQYSAEIERLVFQYGYVSEQAGEITETIFRAFHTDLVNVDNERQAPLELFRIAIQVLRGMEAPFASDALFKFEEDEILHQKIRELEKELRLPFILSLFHDQSFAAISEICRCSETDAQKAVEDALQILAVQRHGKSLEFLDKSYNRLTLTFMKENVLDQKKEPRENVKTKKTGISKKSIGIWLTGIILLMAIVTMPIVTSEEYRASASEKYIEKLTTTFEKEMKATYMQLGFEEPNLEKNKEQFREDYFGHDVRLRFTVFKNNLKRKIERGEALDKSKIRNEYEDIVKNLELPSEMAERIISHPLRDDADKSENFMIEYIRKYNSIQNEYYLILAKHEILIKQAIMDSEDSTDINKVLTDEENTPAELRNALIGMQSQNIEVKEIKEWNTVYPSFIGNGLDEKIRAAVHADIGGYILIVSPINHMYNSSNVISDFENKYKYLLDIEHTLVRTKQQSEIYDYLRSIYSGLFHEFVIGSEPEQRFDTEGKLKSEYRELWQKLAETEGNSPSAFAMKQIIKDIEANEWKKPYNYEFWNSPIFEAVEAARLGYLDSFVWQIPTFQEEPFIDNETFSPEVGITKTDNQDYRAFVESNYNKIAAAQNKDAMATLEPIIVLGVYLYANEQQDPGTMWLLSNREMISKTKEEFVESWNKQKLEINESAVIYAETGGNEVNGDPLIPIRYEFQEEEIYDGWLIWNSELEIWEIHTPPSNVAG